MDFNDYEKSGQAKYARLAATVANILDIALRRHPDMRVQQIQHRSKGAESLRKKIVARGLAETDELELQIKDLAGCRILLYTNADVARLVHSSVFRDNFEIDWDRTKFHYPFDDANADQLFISYNYVVRLKEPRTELAEYTEFRDMWCEVQIQTTLDHAWSEMAHDTIYKPETVGFGARQLDSIRERMTGIMQKYLLPAGFDFQKVADDVAKLRVGYELYKRDPLKVLAACSDNNERSEVLRKFKEYVLHQYDDVKSQASAIRAAMLEAVRAAHAAAPKDIELRFGRFSGQAAGGIVDLACDILDRLCFLDETAITATFDALGALYELATTDDQRKRILQSAGHLSENDLDIWEARGPLVQQLLLGRIEQMSAEDIPKVQPLVERVLEEILKPEVSKTTSTYSTVTFHQGAVSANEEVREARGRAIAKLQGLFDRTTSDVERMRIVQSLNQAHRLASQGTTGADFLTMVISNAVSFIAFFRERWTELSFELRQKIEHDILWIYRHRAGVSEQFKDDSDLADAVQRLREAVTAFRAVSNQDPLYVAYKTLVGHTAVLESHWDGDPFDRDDREAQVDQLIDRINEETFDWWRRLIDRAARTPLTDGAIFMTFKPFLAKLADTKPELAARLLENISPGFERFIPNVLMGLEEGAMRDQAMAKVQEWIGGGQYLAELATFSGISRHFKSSLLKQVSAAAIGAGNTSAVVEVLRSAADHLSDNPALLQDVFMPAVRWLSAADEAIWIVTVAHARGGLKPLLELSDDDVAELLQAFVPFPKVDYSLEQILIALLPNHAQKVADYFGARLAYKAEKHEDDGLDERYEAIPFAFHQLPQKMIGMAEMVAATARRWREESDEFFQFRGAMLVSRLFPEFSVLEPVLAAMIVGGDQRAMSFVLDILRSYSDAETAESSLCREIIAMLAEDDPLVSRVEEVLEKTGMMSGEFGRVEALQHQKAYMQTWLNDECQRVRSFAANHILGLDRAAAADQRRSMEELQLRKREYGE